MIRSVLETPLTDTLNSAAEQDAEKLYITDDSKTARLELLSLLFNHSRKDREKEGA